MINYVKRTRVNKIERNSLQLKLAFHREILKHLLQEVDLTEDNHSKRFVGGMRYYATA
jgi:hypothetical protein